MGEIILRDDSSNNKTYTLPYPSQNIQNSLDEIRVSALLLDYEARFSRVASMRGNTNERLNIKEELTFYKESKMHYLRFNFLKYGVFDFVEVHVDGANYGSIMYTCKDERSFLSALVELKSNL